MIRHKFRLKRIGSEFYFKAGRAARLFYLKFSKVAPRKIICLALVVTFISLDISYAYPCEYIAQNSTVAAPSVFQVQPVSRHAEEFQRSVLADGNLLGTVCSIGKFLLEDGLKLSYLAGVLGEELGDAVKYVDLSKVSVTIMYYGAPEELDPSLLVDTPQSAIVLIPYDKDGKKGKIELALKDNPIIDKLAGYRWVVSDKYVIKELPDDYKGPALRAAPEVETKAPVQQAISEPVAQVEVPLTKTEKEMGVTSKRLSIRAIILSSLLTALFSSSVFAGTGGAGDAFLPSVTAFSALKNFVFAHPIIVAAPGIAAAFALALVIWRHSDPVSWHLFWVRFDKNKVKHMNALVEVGKPAVPALIRAIESGATVVRWCAVSALGNIGPVTPEVVPALIKKALSGDNDQNVRWAVTFALGGIPMAPEILPALIKALGDSDIFTRAAAASIILNIDDSRLSLMREYLEMVSMAPYDEKEKSHGVFEGVEFWEALEGDKYYEVLKEGEISYILECLKNDAEIEGRYIPYIRHSSKARLILNISAPAAPLKEEVRAPNADPDNASLSRSAQLFEIVESPLNNRRAQLIKAGNELVRLITKNEPSGIVAKIGNLHQEMATVEIVRKIKMAMTLTNIMKRNTDIFGNIEGPMEFIEKNLNQFEADALVGSLIVLARSAKREDQKLIIGLETDWIPGIDKKDSLQTQAISSLISEIKDIGGKLRSMGLDNVEILCGSGKELAGTLREKAGRTGTKLHNIVVMASSATINSDSFAPLRDIDGDDRPFLAGIDPTKLIEFYEEYGETTGNQLHIRLTQLLYMTIEFAMGKEPPIHIEMVASYLYDKSKRTIIFVPWPEKMDYEKLRNTYRAEQDALVAA